MNNAHNDMIFRMLRMVNQRQTENLEKENTEKRQKVENHVKKDNEKNKEEKYVINVGKKKKKKCRHCKTKKGIAYKNCDYCSKFYCIKCCGPTIHKCKNLEEYREKEKNRLKKQLMSADSNFKKMEKL